MKYLESFDQKFAELILYGIPNKRFWEFVKRTGWEKYCKRSFNLKYNNHDSPYSDHNLLDNIAPYFSFDEFLTFELMYNNLYKRLNDKLETASSEFGVGDDGYNDLLSSIIGIGRDYCGDILMSEDKVSFKKVREMVMDNNYAENFSYIFKTSIDSIRTEWDRRYRVNHFDENKKKEILNFVNNSNLKRFWEFVEHIGWGNGETEFFKYGRKYVLENIAPYFSHKEFKEFRELYIKLGDYLKIRLKDLNLSASGDEDDDTEYWDLRSSIIGYGKEIYIDVINGDDDNKDIRGYDNRNDYYENFGYIFIYDDNTDDNIIDITIPSEDCKEEWDIIYNENNG